MANVISGLNCADVWEKSVAFLVKNGQYVPSVRGPVLEASDVVLTVLNPFSEPVISPHSPAFKGAGDFANSLLHHERILSWHGIDQIREITALLVRDAFSRRAVVSIWDPIEDLSAENAHGIISLTFSIRARCLNMTTVLRTTDAWMCNWTLAALPTIQRKLSEQLGAMPLFSGLQPGYYTQFHINFHMYLEDIEDAKDKLQLP
jgi:hypothetical protein